MSFFYEINQRLNSLINEGRRPDFPDLDRDGNRTEPIAQAAKQAKGMDEASYSAKAARAGKDIGKPGKNFEKIAKSAAERYGSKERGEKVAGAVLAKLRAKESIDEADMEEGNEFSGKLAQAKAAGAKEFEVDGKMYPVKEGRTEYDPATGITRHYGTYGSEYQGDDGDDDDFDQFGNRKPGAKKKAAAEPGEKRGRGRPKGTGRAIGARGPTGKSKLMREEDDIEEAIGDPEGRGEREAQRRQLAKDHKKLNDLERKALDKAKKTQLPAKKNVGKTFGPSPADKLSIRGQDKDVAEDYDRDEYDEEGEMAKSFLRTIEDAAEELQSILSDNENLPEWVQKKITLAKEYVDTARDYLKANRPEEVVAEKAVSKAQRAAAGIARAAQKGEIPKSELRGASKEMAKMPAGELKKFAKTKEKGLPEKKKKEKPVEETTTAGSVATAPAEGAKTSKGSMQFGKGIYDSWNRELESMISESMTVNLTVSSEHGKNLTVTATDDDADKLAGMLNLAGMSKISSTCPRCHQAPCGCDAEIVDENQPDYPTNTQTSQDALQYAGGLNKPKTMTNPNADKVFNPLAAGDMDEKTLNLGPGAMKEDQDMQRMLTIAGIKK